MFFVCLGSSKNCARTDASTPIKRVYVSTIFTSFFFFSFYPSPILSVSSAEVPFPPSTATLPSVALSLWPTAVPAALCTFLHRLFVAIARQEGRIDDSRSTQTAMLHASARATPVMAAAGPVPSLPLTRLLCCAALLPLLLLCTTCDADNIIIFPSGPRSYDETQAACANSGGALVEARTPAIEREYTALMGQYAQPFKEITTFLGGSRNVIPPLLSAIYSCPWCWRPNQGTPCNSMSTFYFSALRLWGRPVPGMFVNWARGYPGGPRTQQFVAHTISRGGWVDAMYRSRKGMSHTVCYIADAVPPPDSSLSSESGDPRPNPSSNVQGLWGTEVKAPDRRGVGGFLLFGPLLV